MLTWKCLISSEWGGQRTSNFVHRWSTQTRIIDVCRPCDLTIVLCDVLLLPVYRSVFFANCWEIICGLINKQTGKQTNKDDYIAFSVEDTVTSTTRWLCVQVRASGKRACEVYTDTLTNIAKKFKLSDEQAAVVTAFPSYSEVRVQLARHRTVRCIPEM